MAGAHDELDKFKSELKKLSEEELAQKRSSFLATLNKGLSLPDGGRKLRVQLQLIDELQEALKQNSDRFLVRSLCRLAAV